MATKNEDIFALVTIAVIGVAAFFGSKLALKKEEKRSKEVEELVLESLIKEGFENWSEEKLEEQIDIWSKEKDKFTDTAHYMWIHLMRMYNERLRENLDEKINEMKKKA